jgi:hypothetical protein
MFSFHNRVAVVLNPAWEYHEQFQHRPKYPRNTEPKYMIKMPSIEVYANSLKAAVNYTKDGRRIRGQRRRGARRFREAFPDSLPF